MKKNSNWLEEQFRNCNCGVDDVTHEKLNKQNKGNLVIFSVNVSSRPSGPLVPTALCIFPRREAGSSAGFCRGFLAEWDNNTHYLSPRVEPQSWRGASAHYGCSLGLNQTPTDKISDLFLRCLMNYGVKWWECKWSL